MRTTRIAAKVTSLALACLLSGLPTAAGAQQKDQAARAEYLAGKTAYEQKHFDEALEHFKHSYTLSGEAPLLYNIASTLQNLNRPAEAADALKQYLVARPNDPERPELEKRIQDLGQAQVLVDRDNERRRKLEEEARTRSLTQPSPGWLTEADAERRFTLVQEREKHRRKRLAVGLGVGLGGLAVAGIVVGVVCGLGYCGGKMSKDYDFGKATVTP